MASLVDLSLKLQPRASKVIFQMMFACSLLNPVVDKSYDSNCYSLDIEIKFIIQMVYNFIMNQNTKWTPQEDDKLFEAVSKYGTQWGIIIRQLNQSRSQNAIIKRWHGYLKQRPKKQLNEENSHQIKVNKQSKQIKQDKKNSEEKSQDEDEEQVSEDDAKKEKANHEIIKKIQNNDAKWTHNWTQEDDMKLKKCVIFDFIFDWDQLSKEFGINGEQIKSRWIKVVYPKIKNTLKIGGAVKWSSSQDSILYGADKNKVSYMNLMFFLPGRTVYSIEARWRRMIKNSDAIDHLAIVNQRSNKRKQLLSKISKKIKLDKQQKMNKIHEYQKQSFEKQKAQILKYQVMKRSEKARKQYKS